MQMRQRNRTAAGRRWAGDGRMGSSGYDDVRSKRRSAAATHAAAPPTTAGGSVVGAALKDQKQPDWLLFRGFGKLYFVAVALMRALRRDLYRAAVFLWIVPFCTALSMIDTVSPTPV